MKKRFFAMVIVTFILIVVGSIITESALYEINWAFFSVIILTLTMAAFFWSFEKKEPNSKEIALIATMAALAAVSRVPFAVIMGFQPTTFIVMITGYVFGPQSGFLVGAVAALVSNFFLGQGPWTPWQMLSWGLCGVLAGLLAGKRQEEFKLVGFTLLGGVCGFLFGWVMNIWHWVGFVYPLNLQTFIATYIASLPFDAMHAAGNIVFSILFGKSFYRVLLRFQDKMLYEIKLPNDLRLSKNRAR